MITMVKQKIFIKGITEKEGKSGQKYFIIDTIDGKMSCFPDYKGLDDLRTAWKNDTSIDVNVETSEDGKFKNIRNEKKGQWGSKENDKAMLDTQRKSVKGSAYEKDPVGLAVEVFNALITKAEAGTAHDWVTIMRDSIDLVRKAQKAFE